MGDGWSLVDGLKVAAGVVFPPYGAYQVAEAVVEHGTDLYADWRFGEGTAAFANRLEDDPQLANALSALNGGGNAASLDTAKQMHDVDPDVFRKLNNLADADGFSEFVQNIADNPQVMAMVGGGAEMSVQDQVAMIGRLNAIRAEDPTFFNRANTFMDNYGALMSPEAMQLFGMDAQGQDPLTALRTAIDNPLLSDPAQAAAISGVASALIANPDLKANLQTIMGVDAQTGGFDLDQMQEIAASNPEFLSDLNQLMSDPSFAPAMDAIAGNPQLLEMIADDNGQISQESMVSFIGGLQDRMEAAPDAEPGQPSEYLAKFNGVVQNIGPLLTEGNMAALGIGEAGPDQDPLTVVDGLIEGNLLTNPSNMEALSSITTTLAANPGLADDLGSLMGSGEGGFDVAQLSQYIEQDPEFLTKLSTVIQAEGFSDLADTLANNEGIQAMLNGGDSEMSPAEVTNLVDGLAARAVAPTAEGEDPYFVRANDFISRHGNLINQGTMGLLGGDEDDMDMLGALDMGMDTYDGFKDMASEIGELFGNSQFGEMLQGLVDTIFQLIGQFSPMLGKVNGIMDAISNPREAIQGPEDEPVVTTADPDADVDDPTLNADDPVDDEPVVVQQTPGAMVP